jgi:hypothetical protein
MQDMWVPPGLYDQEISPEAIFSAEKKRYPAALTEERALHPAVSIGIEALCLRIAIASCSG